MLRDRYAPGDLFALVPALTLTSEPGQRRGQRLVRRTGSTVEADRRAAYARLCPVTRAVVRQAERVRAALGPEAPDRF